ncbi:hypothetical protein DNTS_028404 [Danionella cerebrum]|uniref:C2H2-type domain-containing protein n=1 Tax=Danionella cerebrum TaxID=2873325 RepID=A0A553N2S5_9TELE|nr:hypothetical protein DNTS_028404 [Danionella translucida]
MKLLSIVQQKASLGGVDSTLKLALSILWNLTDESPTVCQNFIRSQGLELYMELLETYHSEFSILQKILGLLNNVAEVEYLRPDLMVEELVEHVLSLLTLPQLPVDIRYFAGGFLAHLSSTQGPVWKLDLELLISLQETLHSSILSWSSPEQTMVSYKSFQPFFPLLELSQCPGVQLWALWAIHFICSQNAPKYCDMLQCEGGIRKLRILSRHFETHSDVRSLVESILKILDSNPHPARTEEDIN